MRDWQKEIEAFIRHLNINPMRETEIIEEVSQHLNDRYEELSAQGVSEDQAYLTVMEELNGGKLAAELRFSLKRNQKQASEIVMNSANPLSEVWQNLKYGLRVLRLNPGFSAVMILSLALGIGANTAIFQLVNAVRLRTLPVEKPQELANIKIAKATDGRTGAFIGWNPQLTFALWERIRDQQQAFSKIGAWYSERVNLNQGGEARWAQTLFISGDFFSVMKIRPLIGRLISSSDDQRSCASGAALISESFWRKTYGGSTAVLGRKILVDGYPFQIAGVTPASFYGVEVGQNFDIALPLCAERLIHPEKPFQDNLDYWWIAAVGRLKEGWNVERASSQLTAISRGIFEATVPDTYQADVKKSYREMVLGALPAYNGLSNIRRQYENPLWILLAVSGFVLLIACANLANLMLARTSARQKEMAVRLALGASRARLIRQLLAESLLVAIAGALLGAMLAQALSRVLIATLSTQRSILFLDLRPDWHVILFTAGLAILTCVFFGLFPAIRASAATPGEALKANSRSLTSSHSRFESRRLLVVSQVGLSLMLLVGAILFVRTFHNLLTLDAGFKKDGLLITRADFDALKIPPERRVAYKRDLLERTRSLPAVQSAASLAIVPLSGGLWNETISIPQFSVERQLANFDQVSDGYFKTMGTKFIVGRDFNSSDTAQSPLVAIVTEAFVKKFLKAQNPIGVTFRLPQAEGKPDKIYQIIGLVEDVKYNELREDFLPIVFVPESQDLNPDQEVLLMVRSNETLSNVISSIKQTFAEINPAITIDFRVFQTVIREGLLRERLMATLAGVFGLLAAILAVIGLYGVISFMVARRRNEIGIRIALGADSPKILSMILREAGLLVVAGIALGTFLTLIMAQTAKALIFGMQPNDPFTLILAMAALAAIAILASLLPAQRAASVNPIDALREE